MKKIISMILATTVSLGCLVFSASCKPQSNVVKEPKTVNIKLYKAGFDEVFARELQDKFNAVFAEEGYKMNISSAEHGNSGVKMVEEMYMGYEDQGIDLYITGAIMPNQVSPVGEFGELCIDLREIVFNQPAINYDGTFTADKISDRLSEDFVPYLCADNGKMYGFTWAQTSAGMVVNTKKLASYGFTELPRTTDEMFEMFDAIYNGANGIAGSETTKTYPLTYTLVDAATYQNGAFLTWYAQYGVENYNNFLRFQTDNGDGTWTNIENAYTMFDDPALVDVFTASYQIMDEKYAAAGSTTHKLNQAQALIMKEANSQNNAVFMLNGDWFLNEVKAEYSNQLHDIEFMNVPVISALGIKLFGEGTAYGLSDETCDSILSAICKMVDENKTIAEIKAQIKADFDVELADADIQAVASARGTCFSRGIEHLAFIHKDSPKKDIAALVLRMMASKDFADTFMRTANGSSPYSNTTEPSPYKFINQAQALVTNRYFRAINSRVQGLRFSVMATDAYIPHISDTALAGELLHKPSTLTYRQAAAELILKGRQEAQAKWNRYFNK
ncbi:MAG: carbohydrate ABC transporter substrate-binding protein [Clostridia bacterium]|nr:carbohydrate ABC transporter substrate-binding protein [Clostridia bacterium]